MSKWTTERARYAALTRSREPDDPDLIKARQNLHALRLKDHVQDTLPELSDDQRQRFQAWVAEQVSRFRPGDIDAGIDVIRTYRRQGGGAA